MPNLLAIESSSALCSVALLTGEQISSREESGQRSHTQYMLPFVDALLQQANLSFEALDAIAFSAGPGPFTGVRLATSTAKSLAYAANKPVVAVSSLAAIAQAAYRVEQFQGNVLVVTDARMDELYVGEYHLNAEGVLTSVQADRLLPLADFAGYQHQASLVIGDAWSLIAANLNVADLEAQALQASAEDVLALARIAFAAGNMHNAIEAQAVYLRDKSGWKTVEQQQEKA